MSKISKIKSSSKVRYVPYVRGFKCPSNLDKMHAIGFKEKTIPIEYSDADDDSKFFQNIPKPTSIDDWLAQYNEEGQTYLQYLEECPWLSKRKITCIRQKFVSGNKTLSLKYPNGKIYIVPIGKFDESDFVSFNALLDYAKRYLCLPIATLPNFTVERQNDRLIWVDEPSTNINHRRASPRTKQFTLESRYNRKSGNLQAQVNPLLLKLKQNIPADALCLIGLTCHDLYCDDTDLFVAGMAAGNYRVAVFSLDRYDPCLEFSKEFWYKREKITGYSANDRKRLILQRSCKLVVHELCHLLGIAHCIFYDCCMNGSGHLEEDFHQPMMLCPVDLRKLQTLCGFDIIQRYEQLKEFYIKYDMKADATWVERRLNYMKQE